ncbi:MAG: tol-pal system-associated acyl-CoA thioesterase [Wenzhouxiangella sp.]|jgi:acyl-CoA thioester hydrolase|nr:tol-pal system-associated acyl-CoA thioesterase [Wenzhouxiangella sp.]
MTATMHYRVYWEDTDAGGVVYHARYLHFFERARSDWLRELGFPQQVLREESRRVFAVTRMDTRFLAPARLEDELAVSVLVERLRAASVVFRQTARRLGDGELLATAEVHAACLDSDSFKPARAPRVMMAAIRRYQQEQVGF